MTDFLYEHSPNTYKEYVFKIIVANFCYCSLRGVEIRSVLRYAGH